MLAGLVAVTAKHLYQVLIVVGVKKYREKRKPYLVCMYTYIGFDFFVHIEDYISYSRHSTWFERRQILQKYVQVQAFHVLRRPKQLLATTAFI